MKETFEEWLQYYHSKEHPSILDDDLPDHYAHWSSDLGYETWIILGDKYGKYLLK